MVYETVEFTSNYFDDVFASVKNGDTFKDIRIECLKKFVNSIDSKKKSRIKTDVKVPSVISVQVMDNLKYFKPSLFTMLKRVESDELKIFDENNNPICDIMVASFGKNIQSKNRIGEYGATGWYGDINKFFELMQERENEIKLSKNQNTSFYMNIIHDDIIKDKKNVEFVIFGVITKNDSSYDAVAINLIGIQKDRLEEINNKNILRMFDLN